MNEDEFLDKARKQLDNKSDQLDAATLSRLNQARQAALAQLKPQQSRLKSRWIPVSGLAAAVLLTSVFLFKSEEIINASDPGVDEIEILAARDNLELYEQLDFYLWLIEEDSSAG